VDKKLLALGATLVAFVLGVVIFYAVRPASPRFIGTVFDPALPAPGFELADHLGRPFSLAAARGKIVLMYFGYTHCPDECPLTMAKLKSVLDLLDEDARRLQVVLISTDPARDTPTALRDYLAHFDPSYLGLTGTPSQLQAVYDAYGVAVMDDGETHSNRVYAVDAAGQLRLTFMYELSASEMAADLRLLLNDG
jgi:protein SCO1/2